MIITKLQGGLGNQFFQYAVGRAVAKHHKVSLKLDITSYKNYKLHKGYRLNEFNIEGCIATQDDIRSLVGSNKLIPKMLRKTGLVKSETHYVEKKRSVYDPEVFTNYIGYLDGYWQNELYFAHIRDLLLRELRPKKAISRRAKEYQMEIESSTAVSLHVRRGDYLKHPEIGVLDVEYYQKAVAYIMKKVESPIFFVFSDDLKWCKENLDFLVSPVYVEDTKTEIDDLILMSCAQHNIIANSSFSWWSAWLNNDPGKIVIAPKNWRKDDPHNYRYLPKSWKVL